MKHLRREAHPIYDNPVKFGTYGIWEPPTFDVEGFQKRIDAIVGTSLGLPIVRLVWAWDKRCRDAYYTEWDAFGNGTKLEFGYKYRVARIPIGDGDTVDICPPRWILEERYEPGQYTPSWEASRWAEKDIGKRHSCDKTDEQRQTEACDCPPIRERVELKPPAPSDGWYGLHRVIAEHEENRACCERLYREGRQNCWGYYRLPAEKDLQRLQRAVSLRDADDHKVDPHAPMSQEALAHAHRAAFAETQEEQAARDAEYHDMWQAFDSTHGWRAREDRLNYKKLKSGRYHFVRNNPFKQTPSGLYVPND